MASIIQCHFRANNASGNGGAIYVTKKSELKVYNSQFTLNTAKKGGVIAVLVADSFIESCSLTSDTASLDGGCISLNAANMTVKHSHFSGCRSQDGSSITITESNLRLEAVTINDSYGTEYGSALHVSTNSDVYVKDSILTGCRFPRATAIECYESSRVYLESVLISNYSAGHIGCVDSDRCNLTMDNITFTHIDYAIYADTSTINVYNTVTPNDMIQFLDALYSGVTFWAVNMIDTHIQLLDSLAEFRHTLFTRQDEACPIQDVWGDSTIKLNTVYFEGPTDRLVCEWYRWEVLDKSTVVQGHVSGRTFIPVSEFSCHFFTIVKKVIKCPYRTIFVITK